MTEEPDLVFRVYPKIYGPFKRHTEGPDRNKLIIGEWSSPELEYLADTQWRFTEKVDGCFPPDARVLMPDGSFKRIVELVKSEYRGEVMGRNAAGQLEPTLVLDTFDNDKGSEWLDVRFVRKGVGRGNNEGSLKLTPNHRVLSPEHLLADVEGFVRADQVSSGDIVWVARSEPRGLEYISKQVLIGKMLGDGTYASNGQSAHVEFMSKDSSYVDYTAKWLGPDLCSERRGERISGYGTRIVTACTPNSHDIMDTFDSWFSQDHKEVPDWVADELGPIALAFWYMDDGSSHIPADSDVANQARFATNGFNKESQLVLQRALLRLGISSEIQESNKGYSLRVPVYAADVLFALVAPYVPPSMQYKLPARWRGVFIWPPEVRGVFKAKLVPCVVDRVEVWNRTVTKYDLETELHNYVVNGVVVHNCNIRVLWDGHKTIYGGRTDKASLPAKLVNWLDEHLPEELFEQAFGDSSAILYGEGYGAGIQKGGGNYSKEQQFTLFDVRVGNWWLLYDSVGDVANSLGIERVPLVFEGTLRDAMKVVSEGLESQWGEFPAEGVVGVTTPGLMDRSGHRIQVKIKRADFEGLQVSW